jgi:hypothetical protein
MADFDSTISFTITELVATFHDAILALKPVADRARLSWRDAEAYDDWERLVETAFDVFVRSPIFADSRNRSAQPLARYDFNNASYDALSWIEVVSKDESSPLALVRFESGDCDFQSMWLEDPQSNHGPLRRGANRLWSPETKFRFARRDVEFSVTFQDRVIPLE